MMCCMFDCVYELIGEIIRIFLGVVVNLLLNVMDVLSVGGGALLDRPCMVSNNVCVVPVIPVCIKMFLP